MPYHHGMPFCANTTPVSLPTRPRRRGECAERVGLQGDEHEILQSRIGGAHLAADGVGAVNERHPLVAHRFEMRAARDHRDVVPGCGELGGDMAADGSGAEHADSHPARQILMRSL